MKEGAYVVKLVTHDNAVTLIASGSEVELALNVHDKIKREWYKLKSSINAMSRTLPSNNPKTLKMILLRKNL